MLQLTMYENEPEVEELPSYPPDFPANLTALQENVSAMVMSVTCGERLQDVSENFNQLGLSAKIHPVYFNETMDGTLDEYSQRLPKWGIRCRGEYGELATQAHLTDETGFLLLPTPQASDGINWTKVAKRDVQMCLYKYIECGRHQIHTSELLMYLGYDIHQVAEFYEMMMGFPQSHTDLEG